MSLKKKTTKRSARPSADKSFTESSNNEIQDIHEFEHKIALSFPQELSRKQFQLQFVLDHFSDLGVVLGKENTRNLVSHYFDTEDGGLYQQGLALRVRYEEDPVTGVTLSRPDVSIKDQGFDCGGTILREEYEAHLQVHKNGSVKPVLGLEPMVKKYGEEWRKKFSSVMSLDFSDYRETFAINCRRTTFKVVLYSLPELSPSGQPVIKKESDLTADERKNAKKLVYEFALDANRFFVPGASEKIKKDYEIEFELKTHDCEYDPDPDSSDDGVSLPEAMAGRDWLREHVDKLIDDRGLTPIAQTGKSKSERGEEYRARAGHTEPCFDELTMRGRTDLFYVGDSMNGPIASNDNKDTKFRAPELRPR